MQLDNAGRVDCADAELLLLQLLLPAWYRWQHAGGTPGPADGAGDTQAAAGGLGPLA
eukprot:SAG22_NODE_7985_length_693_cov_1.021886_1_plen_56_part_10